MDAFNEPGAQAGTGDHAPPNERAPTRGQRVEAQRDNVTKRQVHYTARPGGIETLLSRLEGVRPAGDGRWSARCPVHDDKSPSLSIRDTGETVLLFCFASCDPEAILTAVGLRWSDLYRDPWTCARRRPNEAAQQRFRKAEAGFDPLDHERMILRIAASDLAAGKVLSVEDAARLEVAFLRVRAADEVGAA